MALKRINRYIKYFPLPFSINVYYLLLTGLTLFIMLLFIVKKVDQCYTESTLDELRNTSHRIEKIIQSYEGQTACSRIEEAANLFGYTLTLVSSKGKLLFTNAVPPLSDDAPLPLHMRNAVRNGESYLTDGATFAYAIELENDNILSITRKEMRIPQTIDTIINVFVKGGLVLLSTIVLINYLISKKITGPIHETIIFAEDFSKKDFSKRILVNTSSDIGSLQHSLNLLADSLQSHVNDLIFEKNKLSITINHIKDAIALVSMDNRIILANKSFKKLFSISEDLMGKYYYEIVRSSELNKNIKETILNGTETSFEVQLQNDTISEVILTPVKGATRSQGLLIALQDITEKKQIDTMKTELIGNLSHELKTPIAIVKGYLETVEMHIDKPALSLELVEKSIQNLDRQNAIINDMLELNRLETRQNIDLNEINITPLIENCLNILTPKIQAKKISVQSNIDSTDIIGNRFLAEQIFFNLIANAINYNRSEGSIEISSETVTDSRNQLKQLNLLIKDSGIGIAKESVGRIFERFYRADKGRSRETGGTGLGLAIVKHAAELMNWNVQVLSEEGEGSTFIVSIPVYSQA